MSDKELICKTIDDMFEAVRNKFLEEEKCQNKKKKKKKRKRKKPKLTATQS